MENNNQLLVKIMEMKRAQELRERHHEAEISALNERIANLEENNRTLLQLLAYVMNNNAPSIVVREEEINQRYKFYSGKNLAGEDILTVRIIMK